MPTTLVFETGRVCAIAVTDGPETLRPSISLTGILLAIPDTSLSRGDTWRRKRSADLRALSPLPGRCYRRATSAVSERNIGWDGGRYRFALYTRYRKEQLLSIVKDIKAYCQQQQQSPFQHMLNRGLIAKKSNVA